MNISHNYMWYPYWSVLWQVPAREKLIEDAEGNKIDVKWQEKNGIKLFYVIKTIIHFETS